MSFVSKLTPLSGNIKANYIFKPTKQNIGLLPTRGMAADAVEKLTTDEIKKFNTESQKLIKNKLRGLSIRKNIMPKGVERLLRALTKEGDDSTGFVLFATSSKPAFLTDAIDKRTLDVIKTNGYDVVVRKSTFPGMKQPIINSFILKKNEVKSVIEKNIGIYKKRLNLPEQATLDEIYKLLISEGSPLKNEGDYADLIGITLGYPKVNAIIFMLRNQAEDFYSSTKAGIKKAFMSKQSPYKDFDDNFKKQMLSQIEKIELDEGYGLGLEKFITKDNVYNDIWNSAVFVDEPEEFSKIITLIRTATAKLTEINSKHAKFRRVRHPKR